MPSASRPYTADSSSADLTNNLSLVLCRPGAEPTPIPQDPEKFRIGNVVDSARLPPLGADGFEYAKCVKSARYFRSCRSEIPCWYCGFSARQADDSNSSVVTSLMWSTAPELTRAGDPDRESLPERSSRARGRKKKDRPLAMSRLSGREANHQGLPSARLRATVSSAHRPGIDGQRGSPPRCAPTCWSPARCSSTRSRPSG